MEAGGARPRSERRLELLEDGLGSHLVRVRVRLRLRLRVKLRVRIG